MVLIQSIKEEKKEYQVVTNKGEYHLAEDTLVHFFITKNKEYSIAEWDAVLEYNDSLVLYNKALNYLSFKERTIKEMRDYLISKGANDPKILIDRMIEKNLINDEVYVEHFFNYCLNNLKGPKYFEHQLKTKGVDFNIIDQALINFTDDILFDTCYRLIEKNLKKSKYSFKKYQQSLIQKATTAGFPYGVTKEVILNLSEKIREMVDEKALIEKELAKLSKFPVMKRKQKLIAKGFSYELINEIIDKSS